MLNIQEVLGRNIGPNIGYPDRIFVGFLSPSRHMPEQNLKLGHDQFLPQPLIS
jgi:hypothetical protein